LAGRRDRFIGAPLPSWDFRTEHPDMTDDGAKRGVALNSVAASGFLMAAKLTVGLLTGSIGILAEAAHSLLDLGATLLTYFAVRVSDAPPDKEHPYGHAKIESISALGETALLFLTSLWIVSEAVQRLLASHVHVETTWWAAGVMVLSIAVDAFRARALRRVAKATKSQALEADALHFSSDILSSAVVLAGLGLVWLGYPKGDALAAIGVAMFVCLAGWRLARRTIDTLIDAAPEGVAEQVRSIAVRSPGIAGIDRVRVRPAGNALFIDLDVAVSRTHPLDRVTAITNALEARVSSVLPEADIAIHVRPIALDDERIADRVRVTAAVRGLAVHRVTVQHVAGRPTVSLSLEIDGRRRLGDAHEVATKLEAAIREEIGGDIEVETHIEPALIEERNAKAVPADELRAIVRSAEDSARAFPSIIDVHNIRARRSADGLFIVLHCRFDRGETIDAVHDVLDEFEHAMHRRWPEARRIVVHAEPPKHDARKPPAAAE
jgi:cation diffusion facilitator family transporter